MNRDFAEMLSALSAAGAEFLIVGTHRPRALTERYQAASTTCGRTAATTSRALSRAVMASASR